MAGKEQVRRRFASEAIKLRVSSQEEFGRIETSPVALGSSGAGRSNDRFSLL
jgi:hypothetical protein